MWLTQSIKTPKLLRSFSLLPDGKCHRVLGFILLLVLLLVSQGNLSVSAQSQTPPSTIIIGSLETSDFPAHKLIFRYLSPGQPLLSPLSLDQVTVHENGKEIIPDQLTSVYQGIHFAVALNPNYDLGMADEQGISRLSRAKTALNQLSASLQNDPANRFSLFINPDLAYRDLLNFSALMDALNGYQENIRTMSSSLDSLDQAVGHVTSLEDSQEKLVLFITPSIQGQTIARFEKIAAQAKEAGIALHVWMVANSGFRETATGQKVVAAVSSTGGSVFISNGSVTFPDPGSIIQGMGYSYTASYTSEVRATGTQQLVLSVKPSTQAETLSEPFNFELQVEPIQADFLNLPDELTIVKQVNSGLNPDALPVEVALSFPDRHPREIQSVELWVNGGRVQVNTQPPYGSFIVDLAQFSDANQIQLEARVSDVLGLTDKSTIFTLPITWDETEIIQASRGRLWPLITVGSVLGVFVIIALLVKPWRKRDKAKPTNNEIAARESLILPAAKDFLATFSRMEDNHTPSAEKPHEITKEITLIGKDPSLAQWVIEDEALEPLHAELRILPDGQSRITDFNTISGTWVNFEKVSPRGVELKKGDLVKLGNHLYRFNPRLK